MIKLIVKGNAMSGNRMKLKKGLFSIILLTSSLLFGLDESHMNRLTLVTKNINTWATETFSKKSNPTTYMSEFHDIIIEATALENSIPLVPTTSEKLKCMVGDLRKSLEAMHEMLSVTTTFAALKAQLGSSSLLAELLEKADQDLNELIQHASKHPEDCSPKILAELKKYKNSTFKQCYDEWHPKKNTYFLNAFMSIFRKK